MLRDVQSLVQALQVHSKSILESTSECLTIADEVMQADSEVSIDELAAKHRVAPAILNAWLEYLGIRSSQTSSVTDHLLTATASIEGHSFINGWTGSDALSVLANASDQQVRIPGVMYPKSIAAHPSPSRAVAVAWQSPIQGEIKIGGAIQHVHSECGNGVHWRVELRRGNSRQILVSGTSILGTTLQ